MNLIDIRPDSKEDVAAFIAEQTEMDLATRHVLTLLFTDFEDGVRFVDEEIRKAGLTLTGEVPH